MLQYIVGDLMNDAPCLKRRLICHVVNDIGAFGAGVSGAISKVYPKVEEQYKRWHKYEHYMLGTQIIPFKLGNIQIVPVDPGVYVINMIGQKGVVGTNNPKPVKYASIVRCMEKVYAVCKQMDGEIHCPKICAGLAQGRWETIEELINEIWHDVPVIIYTLK